MSSNKLKDIFSHQTYGGHWFLSSLWLCLFIMFIGLQACPFNIVPLNGHECFPSWPFSSIGNFVFILCQLFSSFTLCEAITPSVFLKDSTKLSIYMFSNKLSLLRSSCVPRVTLPRKIDCDSHFPCIFGR